MLMGVRIYKSGVKNTHNCTVKRYSYYISVMNPWKIITLSALVFICSCTGRNPSVPSGSMAARDSVKSDTAHLKSSFSSELDRFLKDPQLRHASLSYCFRDASNNSLIAGLNEDLSLVPASTMKLFTTAAALEILEPGTRFTTSLQYEGVLRGKTLTGNIIIKGGGDPTFCLGEQVIKITFSNWARALRKAGIDSVFGSVLGDGSIFDEDYIPYTWTWGEINMGYCAAASGLSINGNVYQMFFDPIKEIRFASGLRKVTPLIPEELFYNRVYETETDEEDVYLIGHPQTNKKIIRGSVPKGKPEVPLVATISNPPLAAATEFLGALRENGVFVSGTALSVTNSDSLAEIIKKAVIINIATVHSPTVADIVSTTNQASYNFFAETLLKHIGLKVFKQGGTESGALAVRRYWESKGMDMGGFAMFDGSGVSRFNTFTSRQMVWLLYNMQSSGVSEEFLSSLSVAGVSGTMRTMCINSDAEGNVRAKSGTMSRVKSYAGYANTKSGKTIIFSIMVNNYDGSAFDMKMRIGHLLDALVKY